MTCACSIDRIMLDTLCSRAGAHLYSEPGPKPNQTRRYSEVTFCSAPSFVVVHSWTNGRDSSRHQILAARPEPYPATVASYGCLILNNFRLAALHRCPAAAVCVCVAETCSLRQDYCLSRGGPTSWLPRRRWNWPLPCCCASPAGRRPTSSWSQAVCGAITLRRGASLD